MQVLRICNLHEKSLYGARCILFIVLCKGHQLCCMQLGKVWNQSRNEGIDIDIRIYIELTYGKRVIRKSPYKYRVLYVQ